MSPGQEVKIKVIIFIEFTTPWYDYILFNETTPIIVTQVCIVLPYHK